jgi:ornithine cyclodeaminase/alanine dehydrogenase-like protein (mu-crystallin family)
MRIYSSIDVIEALPYSRLIEDLPRLLTRAVEAPQRHIHTMKQADEPDASLLLMPAWNASLGGIKVVNVVPGNAVRSLPAVTASYLVFDAVTGEHKALLDGGELTARRTAAVAALAGDRLAIKSAHRLLLVGSGRIATELAFAYRAVRDIRHVEVFSPTRSNAERLVHHLRSHGFDAEVCGDLQTGVKAADIIACATLSIEPLVRGAWLKAGQHVALIGGYTPAMREADDATMGNAVWIDSAAALGEAGDLIGPGLTLESVRGTLRDLCEVAATKDCDEVVTVFKSVGDASQDLAAATLALGM